MNAESIARLIVWAEENVNMGRIDAPTEEGRMEQYLNEINPNWNERQRDAFRNATIGAIDGVRLQGQRETPEERQETLVRRIEVRSRIFLTRPEEIPLQEWSDRVQKVEKRNIYITNYALRTTRVLINQGFGKSAISRELARVELLEKGELSTSEKWAKKQISKKSRGWRDAITQMERDGDVSF